MPDYATQALYCSAATKVSLQKLLSLHKSMQVGVGVQSYSTPFALKSAQFLKQRETGEIWNI